MSDAIAGSSTGSLVVVQSSVARRVLATLSTVGFIALASVIMVLALVTANNVTSLDRAEVGGMATTSIMVTPFPTFANGLEYGLNTQSISSGDVAALSSPGAIPAATFVAPVSLAAVSVQYSYRKAGTVAIGSTAAYLPASGYRLASGSFFTNVDYGLGRDVVVIGSSVRKALFGSIDPVGQAISIGDKSFTVIGVLASRGFASALDLDNVVIVPQTSASVAIRGLSGISQVLIGTRTPALAQQAAQQAEAVLLSLHQIYDPAEANFTILSHDSFIGPQVYQLRTLKRTLALFALILFIVVSIHLAQMFARRDSRNGSHSATQIVGFFDLARTLMLGVIGGLVGLGIGVLVEPFLRVLAPSVQFSDGIGWSDAGAVILVAVGFSIASLFPAAIGYGRSMRGPKSEGAAS